MRKRLVGLVAMAAVFTCLVTGSLAFKADKEPGTQPPATGDSAHIAMRLKGSELYETLGLAGTGLAQSVFLKAWHGYEILNAKGSLKKNILTIADMGQSSCKKRLYVIDVASRKLLINTLVAHGRNSGESMATRFSNINESLQTSLGFYITGATYQGGNGYSMRLKGLEKGFNDLAESRAIVMHGAPYVNEQIARSGRIGRSWGCPAVSQKEHKMIIDLVKNGSCLFIYAPEKKYLAVSELAREDYQL